MSNEIDDIIKNVENGNPQGTITNTSNQQTANLASVLEGAGLDSVLATKEKRNK